MRLIATILLCAFVFNASAFALSDTFDDLVVNQSEHNIRSSKSAYDYMPSPEEPLQATSAQKTLALSSIQYPKNRPFGLESIKKGSPLLARQFFGNRVLSQPTLLSKIIQQPAVNFETPKQGLQSHQVQTLQVQSTKGLLEQPILQSEHIQQPIVHQSHQVMAPIKVLQSNQVV